MTFKSILCQVLNLLVKQTHVFIAQSRQTLPMVPSTNYVTSKGEVGVGSNVMAHPNFEFFLTKSVTDGERGWEIFKFCVT